MADPDDDLLDGCEVDFNEDLTTDDDLPFVALFAGVPEDEIEKVAGEYRELLS